MFAPSSARLVFQLMNPLNVSELGGGWLKSPWVWRDEQTWRDSSGSSRKRCRENEESNCNLGPGRVSDYWSADVFCGHAGGRENDIRSPVVGTTSNLQPLPLSFEHHHWLELPRLSEAGPWGRSIFQGRWGSSGWGLQPPFVALLNFL